MCTSANDSELIALNLNMSRSWSQAIRTASSSYKALNLFTEMHRQSIPLDSFSILFTLKSCTPLQNISILRHLHAHVFKLGFTSHVYVGNGLLYCYVLTLFGDARILFDELPERNTITWNTMISGYWKCGSADKARLLFEKMPQRDVASWSAMIAGYVNNGDWKYALSLCRELLLTDEGLKPDQITFGSVLSGCANMGSIGLVLGKSVHGFMVKRGWELDVEIGTVLVDLYAKCGSLSNAHLVFELMKERNVISWTTLIFALAQHGYGREALDMFKRMHEEGVRPNEMTFTGILSACVRTGLVEEGRKYFKMIEENGLEPRIQHYGCMVDLFGKAGMMEDAYEMIRTMKLEPNVYVWSSFLSACKLHRQFEMAERVIEQVLRVMKPENDGGVYALISDLYVMGEKWDEGIRIRELMSNQHVKKVRGSSFIKSGIA